MQEFLRGERERIAARPSVEGWLRRVRKRKEAVSSIVSEIEELADEFCEKSGI